MPILADPNCLRVSKIVMITLESAKQSLQIMKRKVRAPKGKVPGNAWRVQTHG